MTAILGVAALTAVMAGFTATANAITPKPASAAAPSWASYLRTPAANPVPVKVLSTSGTVSNAGALVSGKGVATLSTTATGKRARVVLDYGQEVGGTPLYKVTTVKPGAAASLTLHSAFSETVQYLFTPGSTTLATGAAAGSTTLRVGATANFVAGDTAQIGSRLNGQQVKIVKVGSSALATTLTSPSAVGDKNIKVGSVGSLVSGDQLSVGGENATIASVGSPTSSTSLLSAAAAGATSISVFPVTVAPGDVLTIGTQKATVKSSSGGFPTTIVLTAPLATAVASGASVSDPGSGITLAGALNQAHAGGAAVTSPGSGITISPALSAAYSAGESVTSTPGAATGDYTPAGAVSQTDVAVTKAGSYSSPIVGGFRYQVLELDSPGTITLSRSGITFTPYRATADKYQGSFESSSKALTQLYYDGAYTVQMNMQPAATNASGVDRLVDGAKRDQRIWSGDLLAEIATMESTLGSNAAPYIKGDLTYLINNADANGQLASVGDFKYYSLSYSIDTALAAVEYYRYSGDTAFATYALPALRKELAYLAAHKDTNGLIATDSSNGMDWAFDNGASIGEVSYFNMLYDHLLTEMSYLETNIGTPSNATANTDLAADVKTAINAKLYSSTLGAYVYTDSKTTIIPQDANAVSVLWGIAPQDKVTTILNTLKTKLWNANGAAPYTANAGFRTVMSPYITGFEVDARYAAGDASDALTLTDNLWGNMSRSPLYNGTFWEELQYDGSLWMGGHDSLAHGWSSGPTYQASQYILGIQPIGPGYSTWAIAPNPSGLTSAKGSVPTATTPLSVAWTNNVNGFSITVKAPAGTSGTITLPNVSGGSNITINGAHITANSRVHSNTITAQAGALTNNHLSVKVQGGATYTITATR